MKIKTIFISDCHLGARTAQTDKLLEFLEAIDHKELEALYIVGDFIDGYKLQRSWYWDTTCNAILMKLFTLLKHGTKIYWCAGNHDDFLRHFLEDIPTIDLAGLMIQDEFIYHSISGDRILVIHGDKFDTAIRCAMRFPLLITICDMGYDYLINFNSFLNYFRRKLGWEHWSISQAIKSKFKDAIKYISNFEVMLSHYARERDFQGIICGHIHKAEITKIDDMFYANCGDWVESCTAVVETDSGDFEIFRFDDLTAMESSVELC